MSELSRRDLLRASAGAAAVAVPIIAFGGAGRSAHDADQLPETSLGRGASGVERGEEEPMMLYVPNPRRGTLSIFVGAEEVVVEDRQLVDRIVRAATPKSVA